MFLQVVSASTAFTDNAFKASYRGTSLIRNPHPHPSTTIGA